MLKVSLKVVGGKHDTEIVPVTSPKFLIGRETDCHLRPNSEMVSRHHCAFSVDDFAVRLRDLGSTNGTLVNGERIRGVVQLKANDLVTVGKLEFRIQIGAEAVAKADTTGLQSETAQLSSEETHYEIPTFKVETEPESATDSHTTVISREELQPVAAVAPAPLLETAVAPQQPPQPQPQGMPGYQYPPGQYPGQYQQPPGYPYGMGFPGQMPGYYPQYPQYPPYPQYPYPQPVVMGQPYPGYPQQQPAPQEAPPASTESEKDLPTRLPDPATSGYKPPVSAQAQAPVAAADGSPPPPPPTKNPSQHAADIIRQHLHRRPEVDEK